MSSTAEEPEAASIADGPEASPEATEEAVAVATGLADGGAASTVTAATSEPATTPTKHPGNPGGTGVEVSATSAGSCSALSDRGLTFAVDEIMAEEDMEEERQSKIPTARHVPTVPLGVDTPDHKKRRVTRNLHDCLDFMSDFIIEVEDGYHEGWNASLEEMAADLEAA